MTIILNEYKNASVERRASLNIATKKWRAQNPDKIKEIRFRSDQKRKVDRREKILFNTYGITLEEYNIMVDKQDNTCAICFLKETQRDRLGNVRNLSVDHNHKTNKVRALLCSNCNKAIGNLKENISLFINAMEYLKKYNV